MSFYIKFNSKNQYPISFTKHHVMNYSFLKYIYSVIRGWDTYITRDLF